MTILSDQTIDILKNFSIFNPKMILDWPSKRLAVANPAKSVIASAFVPESWADQWEIADVPQLLSMIEVFDDPGAKAEVVGRSLFLSDKDTQVEYKLTHAPLILQEFGGKMVPKEIPITEVAAKTVLTKETLKKISKAAHNLRNTHVRFSSTGGKLHVTTVHKENSSSGSMKIAIDADITDDSTLMVKLEYLNVLADDYNLTLTKRFVHLHGVNNNVQYWIVKD